MHSASSFAVLDMESELSRHYQQFRPRTSGKCVRAYQERPKESQGDAPKEQLICLGSRKRKRSDRGKNQGEDATAARHASKQGVLAAAHALFRAWLAEAPSLRLALARGENEDQLRFALDTKPSGLESFTKRAQDGEEAATVTEALDLLSLAELKAVLKPKFRFSDETSESPLFERLHGNPDDEERAATAHESQVLIPGRSLFLITDMSNFGKLIPGAGTSGYDCIVVDPPWENRSAKRAGRYPLLPSRKLLSLPIPQLLNEEGGLVVLWMTNRERLHRFVEAELLPAWNLEVVATWHWVKITDHGDLVVPLDIAHRHPYETIILAAPKQWRAKGQAVQQDLCIFAIPGEHSRKPHLGRLLLPCLPKQPKCLELFARELARGWTSAGNEVLKFQSMDRFCLLRKDRAAVTTEDLPCVTHNL